MISIIVPIYKVEKYLSQCLDSIVNQTLQNLEIILVNDGSPDYCGAICEEYAHKDKRIKVYHTENNGLSAARNYGMTRANGEYLGFVDSDDWIEPDMFEVLLGRMEEQQADVAICGYYCEHPQRTVTISFKKERYDNKNDMFKALISGTIGVFVWNKLYRRTCFKYTTFPVGHVFEDIATIYKVFNRASSAVTICRPLYHYRIRKEAISQTHSMLYLIDYWRAHKERYDSLINRGMFADNQELEIELCFWCAVAIARTWRWLYGCPEKERIFYQSYLNEMKEFSQQHLPWLGKKEWPFFLNLSCFMSKFDDAFVFAVLYYLNQVYKITNLNNRTFMKMK